MSRKIKVKEIGKIYSNYRLITTNMSTFVFPVDSLVSDGETLIASNRGVEGEGMVFENWEYVEEVDRRFDLTKQIRVQIDYLRKQGYEIRESTSTEVVLESGSVSYYSSFEEMGYFDGQNPKAYVETFSAETIHELLIDVWGKNEDNFNKMHDYLLGTKGLWWDNKVEALQGLLNHISYTDLVPGIPYPQPEFPCLEKTTNSI